MAKKKKPDDDDEIQEDGDGTTAVNDAWTGLLAISLLALLGATGFLVWDWLLMPDNPSASFRFTNKPPGAVAPAKAPAKVEDIKDKDKDAKDKDKDAKDKNQDKEKDKDAKEKDKAQTPFAPKAFDVAAMECGRLPRLALTTMRREDIDASA